VEGEILFVILRLMCRLGTARHWSACQCREAFQTVPATIGGLSHINTSDNSNSDYRALQFCLVVKCLQYHTAARNHTCRFDICCRNRNDAEVTFHLSSLQSVPVTDIKNGCHIYNAEMETSTCVLLPRGPSSFPLRSVIVVVFEFSCVSLLYLVAEENLVC
jgi:hypothetical protein